jgi:hypothetical protein
MNHQQIQKSIVVCLVLILATPLSGGVFAQSEESPNTATTTSESLVGAATSSEPILETVEVGLRDDWFKKEQLVGNIETGDFVVGPGRKELELSPGESATIEIFVTNRIDNDRIFRLEVEDISGTQDGSAAAALSGDARGPYSIRDYISFEEDTFELKLGERARIPITITLPPDAEPGGYYGSVLVSTVRVDRETGGTAPRSPIVARIGSLIFLTTRGEVQRAGQTTAMQTIGEKVWYERGPIELGILYENTGSVHLKPYGEFSVTNMFGEEVGFVQLDPWFVLPESLRLREVVWDRDFLFGRYTVVARINRGYDNMVDEVTTTFWVLPWKIVLGLFAALFVLIFAIRFFFRTFEFKRR